MRKACFLVYHSLLRQWCACQLLTSILIGMHSVQSTWFSQSHEQSHHSPLSRGYFKRFKLPHHRITWSVIPSHSIHHPLPPLSVEVRRFALFQWWASQVGTIQLMVGDTIQALLQLIRLWSLHSLLQFNWRVYVLVDCLFLSVIYWSSWSKVTLWNAHICV